MLTTIATTILFSIISATETTTVNVTIDADKADSKLATWSFTAADDDSRKRVTNSGLFSKFGEGDIAVSEYKSAAIVFILKSSSITYCDGKMKNYTTVFGKDGLRDGVQIYDTQSDKINATTPTSVRMFSGMGQFNELKYAPIKDGNWGNARDFFYRLTVYCVDNQSLLAPIEFSTDPKIKNGGGGVHLCTTTGETCNQSGR